MDEHLRMSFTEKNAHACLLERFAMSFLGLILHSGFAFASLFEAETSGM